MSLGKAHKLWETFLLHVGGGGGGGGGEGVTQERIPNFSNNQFFSSGEITGKTLSASKNIISNVTLSQTNRLTLDKFCVDTYIPDCWSAPFA